MNWRRKELASKSELEFRLAKLKWYLQRLEEWAKRLHTTKTVGLPHARGHGELYDGVA
jgi:50S ribosomal subunit-associated GTPase HflX